MPMVVVQKSLIFIRHGESVYNAHIRDFGTDPYIRDAPLNSTGRLQAAAAEQRLNFILQAMPAARVVVSPLIRAVETALLAHPSAAGEMEIWPELREVISGCDDIGTPASELRSNELVIRACGSNVSCLNQLSEIWWTVPNELQNAVLAGNGMVNAYRANEELFQNADEVHMHARVSDIIHRLATVEEDLIIIVAHCDLIGRLTKRLGLRDGSRLGWWLRNCEVKLARNVTLPLDVFTEEAHGFPVGASVRVVEAFPSNNKRKKLDVAIGSEGNVLQVDSDDDAYVDFGEIGRHWVQSKFFCRMVAPQQKLRSYDMKGIATYVNECKARKIVVLCGAGLSTSAGIPDFKTLYSSDRCLALPSPTAIFEIDFFKQNPEPFYKLAKEMWPGNFQPTPGHFFLRLLHEKKVLLRCFTQNIDHLERQAGLPDDVCIYSHGNFDQAHIVDTDPEKIVDISGLEAAIKAGMWREFNSQKGGLVKPKISFYGESLPEAFYEFRDDVTNCDLLLVLGTSLRVSPFNELVGNANGAAPRLLIDHAPVGLCEDLEQGFRFHLPGRQNWRDVFYKGSIDEGVRQLAAELGWGAELEALIESGGKARVEPAPWGAPPARRHSPKKVGAKVRVETSFVTNNRHDAREMSIGCEGEVVQVEDRGDSLINFFKYGTHWVRARDLEKLATITQ